MTLAIRRMYFVLDGELASIESKVQSRFELTLKQSINICPNSIQSWILT